MENFSRSKSRQNLEQWLMVAPAVLLFFCIIILPTIATFALSLFQWDGINVPKFAGMANYARLMGDQTFWVSFWNNFIILIVYCTFPIAIGLLLAVWLVNVVHPNLGQRTSNFFRAAYYLPQIIPGTAYLLAWRWILGSSQTGALNSILRSMNLDFLVRSWLANEMSAMVSISVVLIWVHTGMCMIIFIAALSRVDVSLYDSLKVDGASSRQTFFGVILPELSYEVKVMVIFGIIEAFKVFDFTYILTKGGPGFSTYFAAFYLYQSYFVNADIGLGAAITTILTIGVLVISLFSVRVRVGYDT